MDHLYKGMIFFCIRNSGDERPHLLPGMIYKLIIPAFEIPGRLPFTLVNLGAE
jgi:hypothetical protein